MQFLILFTALKWLRRQTRPQGPCCVVQDVDFMEILGQMGCVLFATKSIFSDSRIVVESAQWVRVCGLVLLFCGGFFFTSCEIEHIEDDEESQNIFQENFWKLCTKPVNIKENTTLNYSKEENMFLCNVFWSAWHSAVTCFPTWPPLLAYSYTISVFWLLTV